MRATRSDTPSFRPRQEAARRSGQRIESEHALHAYRLLRTGFTAAPLIAGADKFANVLTHWEKYLAPSLPKALGVTPRGLMRAVGIVEMAAGAGVALKPKWFGYVVSGWMLGIITNLLIKGEDFDIALRDVGLALGAISVSELSRALEHQHVSSPKGSPLLEELPRAASGY